MADFDGGGGGADPTVPQPDGVQVSNGGGGDEPIDDEPPGDDESDEPAGDDEPAETDTPFVPDVPARAPGRAPSGRPAATPRVVDFDSTIETITSTIGPDTWDEVGGPSSIAAFDGTLDLVVSNTAQIHAQIEALLARLRDVPMPSRPLFRGGLATADDMADSDMDTIHDIITSIVAPTFWDEVGGPCSIAQDEIKQALIVSATDDVHDELRELLTRLRRSRYAALHDDRPWIGSTFGTRIHLTQLDAERSLSTFPEPRPEEMAALEVRKEPVAGTSKWRRISLAEDNQVGQDRAARPIGFTLRLAGDRLQFDAPNAQLRIDSDHAAVPYPELTLVELGRWGASARRVVDGYLPWMPHRSNVELARLFDVKRLAGRDVRIEWLQLTPAGIEAGDKTHLVAAFAKNSVEPVRLDAMVDGMRVARLSFSQTNGSNQQVTLAGADGKPIARWERISWDATEPAIAPLTDDWSDFVRLDLRADRAMVDTGLRESLKAMAQTDWHAAEVAVGRALARRPGQPLLSLLRAWCRQRDPATGSHDEMLADLSVVAKSRAVGLTRLIAQNHFDLPPAEKVEILSLQPPETRTADDWEYLARIALQADDLDVAFECAQKCLQLAGVETQRAFPRTVLFVEILLRRLEPDRAVKAVEDWAARDEATPETSIELARLLGEHGVTRKADALLARLMADDGLSREVRYSLIRSRADLNRGTPRWGFLLQAINLSDESRRREADLAMLLAEMDRPGQAGISGRLASRANDPQVNRRLRIRQAQLTGNPNQAADIAWAVCGEVELGVMPEGLTLPWAAECLNRGLHYEQTIALVEARLRSGRTVPSPVLFDLQRAYEKMGDDAAARRAASHDPLAETQPSLDQPRVPNPSSGGFF